ncbi:PKD domain-containing protein [Actinocrinis puniceicyclus]|uniref:PKD domain-containing protein n=1 Tax=Actinocrinis puniceicyclus TaxID=977794 RepID=A0A8J8BDR2_9ACTN|nr:PKD domain-containing protein [Actinocrinis puniceicyclus]MBS2964431.1 PKD domain-containing protein [Actinocrinis puniceicyclus]
MGEPNVHKRQSAVCAAVAGIGILVPATAHADSAADSVKALPVNALSNRPLSAPALLPPGRTAARTVRTHAAGPLSPSLRFSDVGMLSVAGFAADQNWIAGTSYSFDFGDGSAPVSTSGSAVSHSYSKPGTYPVTLTETDPAGDSATVTAPYTTRGTNFSPYGPTRLLDTRNGTGAQQGAVAPGDTIRLKVAGVGSVPANAAAAVLNLTVNSPTAAGVITAYPDGDRAAPGTASVDFAAGQTVATLAVAQLGADGTVDLLNNSSGTVQVIADITGYFTPAAAAGYTSLSPVRLLDTRKGIGAPAGVVGAGKAVTLTIAGADGGQLPGSGITAVALNVTATGTLGTGYVTAYPDGTTRPATSNVNFTAGQVVANTVIVPVGSDGKIDLYNSSTGTQIIADVDGYFSAGGTNAYLPMDPDRIDDTTSDGWGPIPGAGVRELGLIYTADPDTGDPVPMALGMNAFVMTTTVTNTAQSGYLTVYPFGVTRPVVSNLNFAAGQTVANLSLATAGTDGAQNVKAVDYYNGTSGYFDVRTDLTGVFGTY